MADASVHRRDPALSGPMSAQEAALRLLLEEARLLALNAAIESAAAREADISGDDAAAEAAEIAAVAERLLQQIRCAATLERPL